jgi:hypothetical protein
LLAKGFPSPASKPRADEQNCFANRQPSEIEILEPTLQEFDCKVELTEEECALTCTTVDDSEEVNRLLEELLLDQRKPFKAPLLSMEPERRLTADSNNIHPPQAFHRNVAGPRARLLLKNTCF